jgi:hypothetical protein
VSERITCDGCGKPAPDGYSHVAPFFSDDKEWMSITGGYSDVKLDVCSWECLATVVATEIAIDLDVAPS